ncbi:MAG TPA: MobQ family relaxase, partial [Saprospiraceae bacterium]|nr:MobQ family relaxase [Saprospiraceae bacterium]
MAMYHCHVNVFSRGKGLSAVAGAAYRAREKIQEARTGVTPDYSSYQDLAYAQIFLPECAPERLKIRSILWNEVDQVEKASNARTARQIEFSLPKELDIVQNIVLAREIAQTFADEGMIADLTIHDRGKGNPHAHVMLTTRPFDENGNWAEKSRKEYVLDENGGRIKLKNGQWKSYKVDTVDWNKDYKVEQWRERIAGKINEHLKLHGFEQQVDHRSYERQGIERIPTIHLGHYAHRLEQQGIESDRGNINQQIEQANQKIQEIKERVESLESLAEQERQRPEASTPPIPQDLEKQDAEAQEPSKLEPESTHHSRLLEHYVRVAQSIHGAAKPLQDILTEKGIQDFTGLGKSVVAVREPLPQRAQEPETPSPHTRVEESERKRPH